jgi:hypothetical protein
MSGKRTKKLRKVFEMQSGLKDPTKSEYKTLWHRFKKDLKRRY